MPINVLSLRQQVSDYGERSAKLIEYHRERTERLRRVLRGEVDGETVVAKSRAANAAQGVRFGGAIFDDGGDLSLQIPFGREPSDYALIASDGSQILPDRHKPMLFAFVQAACACVVYGCEGNDAAKKLSFDLQQQKSSRIINEDDLAMHSESVNLNSLVSNQRDLLEIELLAEVSEKFAALGVKCVMLVDGSIVPFALLNERALAANKKLFTTLVDYLDRIRDTGAVLVGVIDRPNSNGLAQTCALAEANTINEATLRDLDKRHAGIYDRHILESVLSPQRRTAMFDPNWLVNDDEHLGRFGHAMRACYANFSEQPSVDDRSSFVHRSSSIMRIEMPLWRSMSEDVGAVSAVIQRHVRIGNGYPFILKAAHEEAVVGKDDQAEIENAIHQELMRRGIFVRESSKQEAKDRK